MSGSKKQGDIGIDTEQVVLDMMLVSIINTLCSMDWGLRKIPEAKDGECELGFHYRKPGDSCDGCLLLIKVVSLEKMKLNFQRPNNGPRAEAEFSTDNHLLMKDMVLAAVAGGVK